MDSSRLVDTRRQGLRAVATPALTVAFVLVATLLRQVLDPVLAENYVWSFYYIPIVAAALYGGTAAGLFALLLGAAVGSVFIVAPDLAMSFEADDLLGLGIYFLVGGVMLAMGARLQRALRDARERRRALEREIAQRRDAEAEKERINQALQRQVQEFNLLWENSAIGIAFARDPRCRDIAANPAFLRLLQLPRADNVSLLGSTGKALGFRVCRDGRELPLEALPMHRAATTGEPVVDEELELHRADGTVAIALVSATPIREHGRVRGCFATIVDITERKRFEQALHAGEARERARVQEIKAVMEAVPAVVFIADDPECRTIRTNRLGRELLRLPEGANASKSAPPPEVPNTFRVLQQGVELAPEQLPVQRAARGETIQNFEEDVVYEDGTVRHWLGNATPLFDDLGRPRGAVAAFIDITERKRAEEALRLADQRKDEFLATLGHQLRNPLAPIKSGIELIRKHLTDERRRAWALEVIDRQMHQLSRIIDDLLELSRVASGRVALKRERTRLSALVSRSVETVRPVIAAKGQRLHIELPEEDIAVEVDPSRLVQVLSNLLHNASRHTPRGGMIAISGFARDGRVRLRVLDSGEGIEPAELPRIFELFRRSTRSTNADSGLGVGLAFAKRIVELHGGEISAHSAGANRGAEFRIKLPLPSAAPAVGQEAQRPPRRLPVTTRRILMVDDNRDAVDSLAELLRGLGHQVRCVYAGDTALDATLEFAPDLVILDIDMADTSGYDLARLFRDHPRLRSLPLAALTGYGQPADKHRALQAGFDAHFTKPADMDDLIDYIASVGRLARAEAPMALPTG